jgi:hypothetical protein
MIIVFESNDKIAPASSDKAVLLMKLTYINYKLLKYYISIAPPPNEAVLN